MKFTAIKSPLKVRTSIIYDIIRKVFSVNSSTSRSSSASVSSSTSFSFNSSHSLDLDVDEFCSSNSKHPINAISKRKVADAWFNEYPW